MAARAPRKNFARPFVVTLAALPAACFSGTTSPQVVPSPKSAEPGGEPTVVTDPVPTKGSTPSQSGAPTYTFDQRWQVTKSGETCSAMARVECPKPRHPGDAVPTCNPPPPMKVACPDGWDGKDALTIVQYANQATCSVEPAPVKCPPNVACNPPPPRQVACPTHQ
jgi:hypothetical protein